MLYDDADQEAAAAARASIVAKAERSPSADRQADHRPHRRTACRCTASQSLLADLATLTRNTMLSALAPEHPFTLTARPTPIQQQGLRPPRPTPPPVPSSHPRLRSNLKADQAVAPAERRKFRLKGCTQQRLETFLRLGICETQGSSSFPCRCAVASCGRTVGDRAVLVDDTAEPVAIAWRELGRELDLWAGGSGRATLWWRDDDAAAVTPALERLLELQAEYARAAGARGHPGPAGARAGRAPCRLRGRRRPAARLSPPQSRRPRARAPGSSAIIARSSRWPRTSRRGSGVSPRRSARASCRCWRRPGTGSRTAVVQRLPALGFVGLSTFGARDRRRTGAGPGPGQRSLRSDQMEAGRPLCRHRAGARRPDRPSAGAPLGTADPGEPTGFVTHHLALDAPAWGFVAELLRRTSAHPRAAWLNAREVFRR